MGKLVLGRRFEESVMIGDDIKVTVVDINGTMVRLSIEAPDDVEVWRQEIYDEIQEERDESSTKRV